MRKHQLDYIPIGSIDLPERLVRRTIKYEELEELCTSLKEHGQIHPILVRRKGERYELIAGMRRFMAMRALRRGRILAHIVDEEDHNVVPLALAENLHRAQLPLRDEAEAVKLLLEAMGSIPRVAKAVGKSETWVRQRLDLLSLPEAIQERCEDGSMPILAALELAKIKDPALRDYYLHYGAVTGVSVEQAKRWRNEADYTSKLLPPPAERTGATQLPAPDPHVDERQCTMCADWTHYTELHYHRLCRQCHMVVETIRSEVYGGDSGAGQSQDGDDAPGEHPDSNRLEDHHDRHEGGSDQSDSGEASTSTGASDNVETVDPADPRITSCVECGQVFLMREHDSDDLEDYVCEACKLDLPELGPME